MNATQLLRRFGTLFDMSCLFCSFEFSVCQLLSVLGTLRRKNCHLCQYYGINTNTFLIRLFFEAIQTVIIHAVQKCPLNLPPLLQNELFHTMCEKRVGHAFLLPHNLIDQPAIMSLLQHLKGSEI